MRTWALALGLVLMSGTTKLAAEPIRFEASPGGVPEVSAAWVQAHRGSPQVRLVDVREPEELEAEGRIEGVEPVPLGQLGEVAQGWNPREPVVLICRSGRRSARGVQVLEQLGFGEVASMTGGVLAWRLQGLPLRRSSRAASAGLGSTPPPRKALSAPSLEEALRRTPLRRVRAAALLLSGSEACVDGREDHAVLGTPGGDAGELLLALSTAEDVMGRELREREVRALFEAHLSSFGRFYMHTDDHALLHLAAELRADPRFRDAPLGDDAESMARYLRHPAPAERAALLEHVFNPDNVGCGHLRLVLTHPEEYGVRAALTHALGRVVYERLWREPEVIDFVVLHGDHHEEAVVNVSLGAEVHAFTNIPTVPPVLLGHSVFVNHPEVATFLRREHAKFLYEQLRGLSDTGVSREAFAAALDRKAGVQLERTIGYLAARLPVFELRFADGQALVRAGGAEVPDCVPERGCAQCGACRPRSSEESEGWPRPPAASVEARSWPSPRRPSTGSPPTP